MARVNFAGSPVAVTMRGTSAVRTASVPRAIVMPARAASLQVPALPARPDLALELHSLRMELQQERTRSRALSERMREQLRALDTEILREVPVRGVHSVSDGNMSLDTLPPAANEEEARSSDISSLLERVEASCDAEASDVQAAGAATGTTISGLSDELTSASTSDLANIANGDLANIANSICNAAGSKDQEVADATALARALHESVRDLIDQGMEFRTLAVRRESELKAALEASERARVQAEAEKGMAFSRGSSHSLKNPTCSASDGTPTAASSNNQVEDEDMNEFACIDQALSEDAAVLGLTSTEQAVCEALVSRLEAQVRTLEMQVDCLGGELSSVQREAAEWKSRHDLAEADVELLRKEYRMLQELLNQALPTAVHAPTPARAPARPLGSRPLVTISHPALDSVGQHAGLGMSKKEGGSSSSSPLLGTKYMGPGALAQSQLAHQSNAGRPGAVSRPGGSGSLAVWAMARSRAALSAEPPLKTTSQVMPRTSPVAEEEKQRHEVSTPTLS
mmetsp:Transcript_108416/g.192027  ORF Transcript_108416/g.192027 Transcript_108416/m.192027 type:complete len:513 (+) Transcript_108416:76-1614(+)